MASSKVMASRSPHNPDRPHHPSPSARGLPTINMDDLFRNMYPDSDAFAAPGSSSVVGIRNGTGGKTVEEVWRDIVTSGPGPGDPAMTLEDFLAKAGAVNEEDVRVPAPPTTGAFGMETAMMNAAVQGVPAVQFGPPICVQNGYGVDFGNGMAAAGSTNGTGRGKKRAAVEEVPLDTATQQKQRRMIKNRESAARSRERKQAYTVELESLVTQLEEDNARLLKEEAEMNKERFKQLMKNLIPVVETQRPRKLLRRMHSMEW